MVGSRKGRMQDRRDAGVEGLWKGGMHERKKDEGEEG